MCYESFSQKLYDQFLPHLNPNGAILDAGCGSGRDAKHFKALGFTDMDEHKLHATLTTSPLTIKQTWVTSDVRPGRALLPQLIHAINHATEIEIAVSFIQPSGLDLLLPRFDKLFHHPSAILLTDEWIDSYIKRRTPPKLSAVGDTTLLDDEEYSPNSAQLEALQRLSETRQKGKLKASDLSEINQRLTADSQAWLKYWLSNPINAFVGGNKTKNRVWFKLVDGKLRNLVALLPKP